MKLTEILSQWGITHPTAVNLIDIAVYLLCMVIIGCLAYLITKKWVAAIVIKISQKTPTNWDNYFFTPQLFKRLGLFVAPAVISFAGHYLAPRFSFIPVLLNVWTLLAAVSLVSAILDGVNRIYESYPISRDRPLKVFIQVIMIVLYSIAIIVCFGWLTGREVDKILTGLTVFASVLMLIFKDSILGFVAGIQLSANKMVRIGDWIEMPSSRADGDVLEINLTTVKVQNWDKTITTIPTYKLVSESFTNWRGMEESQGRRIKRSINIDVYTIHYLDKEDIERLKSSSLLKDYIEKKVREIEEYNANRGSMLDERRMTNIGTFREYIESWLTNNPDIHQGMTHMVRQLQPGPTGLPLEIYCFSARQKWVEYEQVQSDLFDHIYAVMPLFGLRAFEYTSLPVDRL